MAELPEGFVVRGQQPEGLPEGFTLRQPKQRGTGEQLARQVGLTARYGIEGGLALPATIANLPASASNYLFGTELPEQNQAISQGLDSLGLPKPETGLERVVGDASRAVVGVGSGVPVANVTPYASVLNSGLGTQAAAATTGATASGLTREAGYGPTAQFAAGIAGGVIPVGGYQAASRGLGAARDAGYSIVEPLLPSGRRQIVGRLFNEAANDTPSVISNLQNVPDYVPNSPVTTGEAAGDAGLAALQRGYRNQAPSVFADIESQQNAARQSYLAKEAGTPQELLGAEMARDATTTPLRESAFSKKTTVQPGNAQQVIGSIAGSPVIKRDAVQTAMQWITQKLDGVTDPEQLYAIRQDLNDAMQGKFNADKPALALAKAQLKQVKDALDNDIEAGAPGFKKYVESYRDQSIPIDQQRRLQELQDTITLTGSPDIKTGYGFISQPKLTAAMRDPSLPREVSTPQMKVLKDIQSDTERSASLNARNIRATGSDTRANFTIKDFLAERAAGRIPVVGSVIEAMSKRQTDELIMEAFKDPKLARSLLIELKPEVAKTPLSLAAQQKMLANILGATKATTTNRNE